MMNLQKPHGARLELSLIGACVALIAYANFLVFMVVKNEAIMGPVQRIFYFHVGAAIACYCAWGVILLAGLGYLATKNDRLDGWLAAASEVGFAFCTITLLTGCIWAHSAWNAWFRFEPRLVTFLLLWFQFLALMLLRAFGEREKIAAHSAVLGIVGSVMVPIVVFSIKLLPHSAQLHPEVVGTGGLKDSTFRFTMFFCMGSMVLLQFLLVWLRARLELSRRRLNEYRA